VSKCIASGKPILAVVHERLEDDLIHELRSGAEETFVLSVENRDEVTDLVSAALVKAAGGPKV
ncbi:MAG TPA: nucleoside-triphosphatase, partial [Nitrososphaerales archaeon]|nr:nucleoside-triphosphatase [Nitrososphaerales archaeon]